MSRDWIPEYKPEDYIDGILEKIAQGITLRSICREEGMPSHDTVYVWLNNNAEYAQRFARARKIGHDAIAEETLDIADHASNDWMEVNDPDNPGYRLNGEHVQRSKLRIETRLKLLAKWDPGRYGDRLALDHAGKIDTTAPDLSKLSTEELAKFRALAAKAQPDAPADS